MRIAFLKMAGRWIALLVVMVLASSPAGAEDVRIDHQGLDLVADLTLAKGKTLKRHGVVVLLHDVMSYKEQSPIGELREALLGQGLNVLAINLSLGLEGRVGRYECAVEQDHLFSDALPEIHAWVKWLQRARVKRIALAGIGLGASQMALYGSKTTQKSVRSIILLSPSVMTKQRAQENYQNLHGKSLPDVLFEAQAMIAAQNADSLLESVGFLSCPQARVTARSFVSYYGDNRQFDTTTLIPIIKKPTLVIAGELGESAEQLILQMQRIEARRNLKLDVIEGADSQFSGLSMQQVAERIKLFGKEIKGK